MTSSPPLPTTIHDLPPETIGHILDIAHPVDSEEYPQQRVRRHFYLDASLVCRDWTPFAQRALWKHVRLDTLHVEQFVESGGAGRYPIDNLVVPSVDSKFTTSLTTLLASVRGVRDLKLVRCQIFSSWLCGANWRDLKSLTLESTIVISREIPAYHFALTHLGLHCSDYDDLSDETLVAFSRQVSITSLQLCTESEELEMLGQLSSLASQLVRLDLDMLDADGAAVPRMVDPFLKRCTQLKHLTFGIQDTPSVIHLPRPLESWTSGYCNEFSVSAILDVLNSKATAVSKLQRLSLYSRYGEPLADTVREVQSWEGWTELEEVCRQKKIRLSVTRCDED